MSALERMAPEGQGTSRGAVSTAYRQLIAEHALTPDPAQAEACVVLDRIAEAVTAEDRGGGFLASLFGTAPKRSLVRGAYLHGEVGRGKTMLMDLFFHHVAIAEKRRVHFHEFMTEIHAAIARFRQKTKGRSDDADPVAAVVKPIIASTRLLCLDEFHVQDITNAMLLQRLFEKLYAGGVVVVATSNVAPEHLYENGLNRQLFLPFIDLLRAHSTVLALNGATDYRRLKFEGQQVYHFGAPDKVRPEMDALWLRLTGGLPGEPEALELLGRRIEVPRAAMGAARFPFSDLCEKPLGAADYLKLAHAYDTVMVDDVPRFDRTRSNASKRFILLIDTLYDRGIRLAASFAAPLEHLGADDKTQFEFKRCVSRLIEMQSSDYLNAPHKGES